VKAVTRSIRRRLGPLGLSLAAAAITAAGLAAFSLADDGKKGKGDSSETGVSVGGPGFFLHAEGLSEEDKQKLEQFRQCMEDQELPAPGPPPRFREGEDVPDPPSREEFEQLREKLEAAHEACADKLPEELRDRGLPPAVPGPGGPPGLDCRREDDGDGSGGEEQSFEAPAPAPGATS
jgi:hypothetical protein